jgi:hypothetical protein
MRAAQRQFDVVCLFALVSRRAICFLVVLDVAFAWLFGAGFGGLGLSPALQPAVLQPAALQPAALQPAALQPAALQSAALQEAPPPQHL